MKKTVDNRHVPTSADRTPAIERMATYSLRFERRARETERFLDRQQRVIEQIEANLKVIKESI